VSLFFRNAPAPERRNWSEWAAATEGTRKTSSGVAVTQTSSLRLGAVWSTTNLLASVVSNLPVDVFRGAGSSKTPVTPQPPLVATPSMIVTRREWVYQAMMSLLLRGNAYGLIVERDALLRPRTIEWLDPDAVTVKQASSLAHPTYALAAQPLNRDDIMHMRAFVRPGSAIGMSPVEFHAETIGVGIAAQQFGSQWFGDGGHPTAIFQNTTQKIDPDKSATIKEKIGAILRGRREPLVLGSDWSYTPIQVNANESQFLEAMGYTDAQVARLYGPGIAEILGYGTQGSSLTYSNRVDRSLDLLTYSVMPWISKFEDMLTGAIAQPQTVRFNVASLLRADPKAQRDMFRIDREIGLHNIDEIRDLLDERPLPDGQGEDYTPLKSAPQPRPEGAPDGNE
jgi:HK97 family phage portal protein